MTSKRVIPWALSVLGLALATASWAAAPRVHALTGARIVVGPDQTIESGTVVIRDGVIEAVGLEVAVPPDARIWEREDLTIYPGLIEPYSARSWPKKRDDDKEPAGSHANALVRPERAITAHGWDEAANKKLRSAGFTTALVAPDGGIFRGTSILTNLGDGLLSDNLLRQEIAQHLSFETNSFGGGYPSSLMGSVALMRQTLLDAQWHGAAWQAYNRNPAQSRPPASTAFDALEPVLSGTLPAVFETSDALDLLRAARLADEFNLEAYVVGTGDEYKWLDEVAATGMPVLVTVDFPEVPEVGDDDDMSLSLAKLRHWDMAPTSPKLLLDSGVTIAFTSHGLSDPKKVLSNLHQAIERGLSSSAALAALTTTPAKLFDIADRAGTVEVGKMANLILVEGELFAEKPEIREVWVDGNRFEVKESKPAEVNPAGTWEITVETPDGQVLPAVLEIEGEIDALSGTIAPGGGDQKLPIASIDVSGTSVEISFDSSPIGMPGTVEFSFEIDGDSGSGSGTSPDGPFSVKAKRISNPNEDTPEVK